MTGLALRTQFNIMTVYQINYYILQFTPVTSFHTLLQLRMKLPYYERQKC